MGQPATDPLPDPDEHFVQLWRTESELTEAASNYAQDVLASGAQSILFFATQRHCDSFRRALVIRGVDVGGALADGRLRFTTTESILPKLTRNGSPSPQAFQQLVVPQLEAASAQGRRRVHVFGEIVNVYWRQGRKEAAVALEGLWNALRPVLPFTLYCAYHAEQPNDATLNGELRRAICTHESIMREVPYGRAATRRVFVNLPPTAAAAETPLVRMQTPPASTAGLHFQPSLRNP